MSIAAFGANPLDSESAFLIGGAIGLAFDTHGEKADDLPKLPDFVMLVHPPAGDTSALVRFKEFPIILDMLALLASGSPPRRPI